MFFRNTSKWFAYHSKFATFSDFGEFHSFLRLELKYYTRQFFSSAEESIDASDRSFVLEVKSFGANTYNFVFGIACENYWKEQL